MSIAAVVKIKNINASHKTKNFVVKGRIKPHPSINNNLNGNGKHLEAILYDKTSSIKLVAFDNDCDIIWPQLEAFRLISIENVEVNEINKMYKITNHKYNLVLKSSKVKITILNDIDHSIIDYPKYPMFCKDLTTLKPETVIDVFGIFTEIGDVDGSRTFRTGKFKVESSEICVKFFGDKLHKVYDVYRPSIIYSTKLKYYQGNFCLNVLNSSYVECSPNLFELSNQTQFSNVAKDEQTMTEILAQPAVSPRVGNIIQETTCKMSDQIMLSTTTPQSKIRKRQINRNLTEARASKSETIPVLQHTVDEIFVHQLLIHINRLSEADKIRIQRDILEFAINYKRDHNGV